MSNTLVVNAKDCKGLRWQPPQDIAFAANHALVPLHAGELAGAVAGMPLAFAQKQGDWQLVAVCGLTANHSLFVRDGKWMGAYTPQAFGYWPFDVVQVGKRVLITFDKSSGTLVGSGGEPFFDLEGNMSQAMLNVKQKLEAVFTNLQVASRAVESLQEAGVLVPWPDNLTSRLAGFDLSGLYYMNEQALAKLDDAAFLTLRRNGALAMGYAVNLSLGQVHLLERLLNLNPPAQKPQDGSIDDLEAFFEGDDNLSF